MLDLEFEKLAPEEWEIATIIGEVNFHLIIFNLHDTKILQIIKAMTYLLNIVPACELHIDSVRLSIYGNIKLGKDNLPPVCLG